MLFGVILFCAAAECVLRFLPVNSGLGRLAVNEKNPVPRFAPNRDATWSDGWDFAYANTVHVNNFGFVNDVDYGVATTTPLLAVIGDSYIEATMVPFAQTLQGRLAARIKDAGRIYSFAASGAGFGTYLAYARYVRETFSPDALVFVIIRNDFMEALYKYERSPSFTYFKEDGVGGYELERVDYEPSFLRRILRKSSLAMYLIANLKIQSFLSVPIMLGKNDSLTHIATDVGDWSKDPQLLVDGRVATRLFLDALPEVSGMGPGKILFVVDASRAAIYDPAHASDSDAVYFDTVRADFISEARRRGYEVSDLDPAFRSDFARHNRHFEFLKDTHWSGEGHRVAADEIAKSQLFQDLFRR